MRCSMFLNLVLKEPTFVEKSKKTNSEEVRLSAVVWSECSTALEGVKSFL